ncbi:MAG TPA: PBP1A family penicillin-binding protein [Candidatus Excrementavichristensenella intestinipullorum]|nr:PBP1A family penicillin-binding protein [Candidatus Excrementavichristensenella intestinipullorum]
MKKKWIPWALLAGAGVLLALGIAFAADALAMLDVDKLTALPQSTVLYDRNGQAAAVLSGAEDRQAVALEQVPLWVRQAFVAAEDARFYQHHGVDFYRIGGALAQNLKSGDYSQGASTITQQLIKLTHLSGEKTLARKAREALLALRLETVMDKDQILEAYLNAVYFGAGAYGIQAASRTYFGCQAQQLTLEQGALLAAIIKAPSTYAPHLHPDNALERRNLVLEQMAEQGYISPEQARQAQAAPVEILEQDGEDAPYPWYVEQAAGEAADILGIQYEELLSGGYKLYTGLDTQMQQSAQQLFSQADFFPPDAADGERAQAALVCLDVDTGLIRAVMGGRDYQVRRGLNRASAIQRQPGSAFKPVSVYAAAVDRFGYLPTSFVEDTQRDFGGGYTPGNVGGRYYGPVTLREALSRSLNVATVDLLSRTSVEAAMQYAQAAGIDLDDAQDRNLALALGSLTQGVSPLALAGAYAPLAGGGQWARPHAIQRIEDGQGHTVYTYQEAKRQVMSPVSARLITDMLQTAASTGTAKALGRLDFTVAGKTGTVGMTGGNRDVWTAAYTPKVALAVWMGFDQPDGEHILSNAVTGSSHPAKLAAAFLEANAQSAAGGDFPIPQELTQVLIDSRALSEKHRAMLVSPLTPKAYSQMELFPRSLAPTQVSDVWQAPSRVFDLAARSAEGGVELSFTAVDDYALYRLYRQDAGQDTLLAELNGQRGQRLAWLDTAPTGGAYWVTPWEKRLLEEGVELAGAPSDKVAPGQTAQPQREQNAPIVQQTPLF